jgi:hypothetical protein
MAPLARIGYNVQLNRSIGMDADEKANRNNGVQRGIYPTLMVRHTIKPGLFEKPHTKHHQCA